MMMSMFRVAGAGAGNAFGARVALVSTAKSRAYHGRCERNGLVEALDNEIKVTELLPMMPAVPGDFPFKLKDARYGGGPILSRKFDEEKISVRVREFGRIDGDGDESSSSEKTSVVDLKVDITKGDGKWMKFVVTASAHEIEIKRLSVVIEGSEPDQMDSVICSQLYIKPDCEMQFALRDFLEKRGIRKSHVFGFLRDYLLWKTKLPYSSLFEYSPTRKFNQQNVEMLTKLKEAIHDW